MKDKAKRKQYKKMLREYKKKFKKLSKLAYNCPSEYSYGLELFVLHLEFMRDYYKLGYNVWAQEIEGHDRATNIEEAIRLYKLAYDVDNELLSKYYNFGTLETYKDEKGQECVKFVLPDGVTSANKVDPDSVKNAELYNIEREYYKKKFYNKLIEEMENWWD